MNQGSNDSQGGERRSRSLFLILSILLLIAILVVLGFMAYQEGIFGESNRDAAQTSQQDQRDRRDQPKTDVDEPEEDQPKADGVELISQTLECLNVYGTEHTFQFQYPESVAFEINTPEVPDDNCEITLSYMDATMIVGKDFGEGYPYNLDAGSFFIVGSLDSTVQVDDGFLDVEYTLIRSAVISDMSPETASTYRYGSLFDDCTPSELIPDLSDPCGAYVHPTAPGIREVIVTIPDSLTTAQVDEIIAIFDQIALTFESEAMPF